MDIPNFSNRIDEMYCEVCGLMQEVSMALNWYIAKC